MVQMTINGKVVKARKDEMLLTAIRRMGIDIPALCEHEAVEPCGACRLCMVELAGRGLIVACKTPVEEAMVVKTKSAKLNKMRRMLPNRSDASDWENPIRPAHLSVINTDFTQALSASSQSGYGMT